MESNILPLYDDGGWSFLGKFINGRLYKLRYETEEGYAVSIDYSEADIEDVEKHFNLRIAQGYLPEESHPKISLPDSLFDLLLRKRISMYSEKESWSSLFSFIVWWVKKAMAF